jgi:hypothetical protein
MKSGSAIILFCASWKMQVWFQGIGFVTGSVCRRPESTNARELHINPRVQPFWSLNKLGPLSLGIPNMYGRRASPSDPRRACSIHLKQPLGTDLTRESYSGTAVERRVTRDAVLTHILNFLSCRSLPELILQTIC